MLLGVVALVFVAIVAGAQALEGHGAGQASMMRLLTALTHNMRAGRCRQS
jgi:hypothetical protein